MNNELFNRVHDTGEWWLEPWWEDRDWWGAERYPPEEMRKGIEVLKELFPAEWAKQLFVNPQRNMVLANLIGHNAGALGVLFNLGAMVRRAQGMPGFSCLLQRLRGEESESAYFELEMAGIFLEKGMAVEFPHPGPQKTPDVIARCPDTNIEIECKRLRTEAWALWESDLTGTIVSEVGHITHRDDFDLQIDLDERITDIRVDDDNYPRVNEAILRGIVTTIKKTVSERLQRRELPVEFAVPGLMRGRALPKGSPGGSYVRGAIISRMAKLRRILTNGVLRGISQLSGTVPGVLCIYSDFLPEPALARTILDALTIESAADLQTQFTPMSALLLFPMQTLFERNPPLLLENKQARFPFRQLEAAQHIELALQPVFG